MAAVLVGPQEVLVIMIVTAIVPRPKTPVILSVSLLP